MKLFPLGGTTLSWFFYKVANFFFFSLGTLSVHSRLKMEICAINCIFFGFSARTMLWYYNLTKKISIICSNFTACKRKEDHSPEHPQQPKKPRLVFTDLQRRTLQAIFKVFFECIKCYSLIDVSFIIVHLFQKIIGWLTFFIKNNFWIEI